MARNDAVADVTGALFDEGWTKSAGGRGEQSKPRGGGRGSRFGRQQQMARAASGNRAIVVKMVRGGGCVNSRQLGNQLEYVTGKADVVIESTGTLEREGSLAPSELREVVDRWSDSWKTAPKTGHTAHLIVSFPPETDARAVQGITQRFCEEMFEGKYDFVAATHSDRHHPHAHIVVNRHSEEHGLLTLRAGTEHSYENYKQVIAELGRYHGVDLEASTRLERGHVHRAPTDADYRNGLRAERPRTGADLAYAQGVIAKHAQTYSTLAALARGISAIDYASLGGKGSVTYTRLDGLAENLDRAAADLAAGRPIIPENYGGIPVEQQERFNDTLQRLGDVLDEAEAKMQTATPAEQVALEARLNEAEAIINKAVPESERNALLDQPASELGIYSPDNAKVAQAHISENGEAAIREAVKDTGLDADVMIARLKEGAPTAALEERWLLDDVKSIAEHQGLDLNKLEDRDAALAALDSIHERVSDAVGMEPTADQLEAAKSREAATRGTGEVSTGDISADSISEEGRRLDPLDTPASYHERFVVTKQGDKQEFYRNYNDERPAFVDEGTNLSTKACDKATALDMVNLAAHRGWESMKVTGPQDFRREVWIEGAAKGIEVEGYKPTERDIEEAARRADLERVRSVTRTDVPASERTTDTKQAPEEAKQAPAVIDYAKGVRGEVVDHGDAPYKNQSDNADSYFVRLRLEDGRTHDVWGKGLSEVVKDNNITAGDKVTLTSTGVQQVTITDRDAITGKMEERDVMRRGWDASDIQRGLVAATALGAAQSAMSDEQRNAVREETISQGIKAEIKDMQRMGYPDSTIGGRMDEIEEKVEARVALAESRGEELGSWDRLAQADQRAMDRADDELMRTAYPKADLARMPSPADAEDAAKYKQAVEERLTPDELARLKEGDVSALDGVGTDSQQLRVAHDYLKADGQSPEALKQVSEAYRADLAAHREQDRGIDHG